MMIIDTFDAGGWDKMDQFGGGHGVDFFELEITREFDSNFGYSFLLYLYACYTGRPNFLLAVRCYFSSEARSLHRLKRCRSCHQIFGAEMRWKLEL